MPRLQWLAAACGLTLWFATAQAVIFTAQDGLLSDTHSGSAIGVVDLNGDRRDDIVRLEGTNQLQIAYQRRLIGGFHEADFGALGTSLGWSVCAADVDGNGYNDLLIGGNAQFGGSEGLELFLANATGTDFTRSMVKEDGLLVQGVIFSDIDNDGHVDVLACHDLDDLQKYANLGSGLFERNDSLLPSGIAPDDAGNYAVIATDFDDDGDVDYYLSKCREGEGDAGSAERMNRLFINDGAGGYSESANARGLNDGAQSWCSAFGDVDNDGDLDVFVLNHEHDAANASGPSGPSVFYRNDGSGNFTDDSVAAGLSGALNFPGAQALFQDFDNDGWLDLLVSAFEPAGNGFAYLKNDGDGSFTAVPGAFLAADNSAISYLHSVALGDLNRDGFLDVFAGRGSNIILPGSDPDLVFFNSGNSNGFFSLTLAGSASNPNGIGARVEAHGPWGVQVRELRGGEGYGIQNSLNVHFGLGAAEQIDRLVVRWPSKTGGLNDVDEVLDVPANGFGVLYQGTGSIAYEFADWIAGFPTLSGDDLLPDADPDRDGKANAFEQVTGCDPTIADGPLPLIVEVTELSGQRYLQIALDRVPVPGTTLSVEFSGNSIDWQEHPQFELRADTFTRYAGRIPLAVAASGRLLCRLRAVIPASG